MSFKEVFILNEMMKACKKYGIPEEKFVPFMKEFIPLIVEFQKVSSLTSDERKQLGESLIMYKLSNV